MYYIITKDNCIYCDKAKMFLNDNMEAYQTIDYKDNVFMKKLMFKAELVTLPQIWHNDEYVGGYNELLSYHSYLDVDLIM